MTKITECQCKKCKECCWHNPGWFGSIEEIEGAAKIMKISVKDFCLEYLIQEWYSLDDGTEPIIPAPRRNFSRGTKNAYRGDTWNDDIKRNHKGFIRASWGHNLLKGWACIFLDKNNLCKIHKSKPQECREVFGCKGGHKSKRPKIARYWEKHQDWIENIIKQYD